MNTTDKNLVNLRQVSNACHVCHAKDLCMVSCLSVDDLRKFEDIVGHRKPLERGQRLFMAGDKIDSVYILHSGSVKSYIESAEGDNQITCFHLPGDVIGLHGIENRVHTDTIEALETSSICEIQAKNFDDIVAVMPRLRSQFMKYVLREMDHEQTLLLVLGKMSAERRIAYFLLDISSRLEDHGLSGERINLSMTRHDIANYLGLALETVSRILTRLQRSGIIEVERRFVLIKDQAQLADTFISSDTKAV